MEKLKFLAAVLLGLSAIIGLLFLSSREYQGEEKKNMYSMFSWDAAVMEGRENDEFISIVKKMDIGSVYQSVSAEELGSNKMKTFVRELQQENVDFYYLTGEREWGLENDGASFKKEIDKIYAYNQSSEAAEKVKGIVVDIEPYLTEEWDRSDEAGKTAYFKQYIDGMIEAYEQAQGKDLLILVCVPNFFDRYDDFARLVALGCDGLTVMNYDRENEIEAIRGEIELARKYDKQVIFIAELQRPGEHELVENNTYYYEGLAALKEAFLRMGSYYDYDKLGYSYHYYKPLKELLQLER